jgi:U3 small nucleolar RNA-associated protein MPP10
VSEYSVLKEVVLKGLDVEQVWEQIRLVGDQVKRVLEKEGDLKERKGLVATNGTQKEEESEDESLMEDENSEEVDEEEEDEEQEWEDEDEEIQDDDDLSNDEDGGDDDDDEEADEFPANPEDEDASSNSETEPTPSTVKPFKKDIHGLNDQFFSIDDFNRLTEAQENLPSEDENDDDIDYFGGIPFYISFTNL